MSSGPTSLEASTRAPLDSDREPINGSVAIGGLVVLLRHWKLLVFGPLLAGIVALGVAYQITPIFSARTTMLPPQAQQSAGASALASLGALAGLAGGAASLRTPADQYAALMQSDTVRNHLIDQFGLIQLYKVEFRVDARGILDTRVRIGVGKKDGLITVEVDDESPERAAALANAHVEQLRKLSSELALTEAQQRRAFFENQVKQTRERLDRSQAELQATGFTAGALRSEPRAAADSYARLRAEVTAAEVRLQTIRRSMTDSAPEVANQMAALRALKDQLGRLEVNTPTSNGQDYVGRYREFKYQEALYEVFFKQLELARIDESKEGSLFQVVDTATPPERKSRPKRAMIAVSTTVATAILLLLGLILRSAWRRVAADPANAEGLAQLRNRRRAASGL